MLVGANQTSSKPGQFVNTKSCCANALIPSKDCFNFAFSYVRLYLVRNSLRSARRFLRIFWLCGNWGAKQMFLLPRQSMRKIEASRLNGNVCYAHQGLLKLIIGEINELNATGSNYLFSIQKTPRTRTCKLVGSFRLFVKNI